MLYNNTANRQISKRVLPGLVSISFRQMLPRDIVALAAQSQLAGIEWGGDIHVPHGDLTRASEVGTITRDAGLAVAAYGSYYIVGESEATGLKFTQVLETAVALGAPLIRVWAGNRDSADTDDAYRRRVAKESHQIASEATEAGIGVAFEFHCGTLTDSTDSAIALMAATAPAGMRCYWQPPIGWTQAERIASLKCMIPHLANLHVYHWLDNGERRPLEEGAGAWLELLDVAASAPRTADYPLWALLEFVRGDNPGQLPEDAAILIRLIDSLVDNKKG